MSPLSVTARLLALPFLLALVTALLCTSMAQAAGALNDSGITFCGDYSSSTADCATVAADGGAYPRQDARYGRDAQAVAGTLAKIGGGGKGFDYSKIANNGTVLPESAVLGTGPTDWACTSDNVTGLIWEVKTTSGLRGQSHTYTWYNSNPASNGGAVGTASGGTCFAVGRCDTEKFVEDVNAAGLCGAGDWRMPRVKELEGIADFGRFNPAIDPTYFPNTSSSIYWSGSPYAADSSYAWYVDFGYGGAGYGYRNDGYHGYYCSYCGYGFGVRLVRGGQ